VGEVIQLYLTNSDLQSIKIASPAAEKAYLFVELLDFDCMICEYGFAMTEKRTQFPCGVDFWPSGYLSSHTP
jgi:hypothetical protein